MAEMFVGQYVSTNMGIYAQPNETCVNRKHQYVNTPKSILNSRILRVTLQEFGEISSS